MAGLPGADEIITQKHKRNFYQYVGPRPNQPVLYAGMDGAYLKIEGVSVPETGGIDPIRVPDPRRPGRYRPVGQSISAPDLPTADLVFLERHGAIPRHLGSMGCLSAYEVTGLCKDPSDFLAGWTDYIQVYENGRVTDKDLGDRSAWDSDDPIEVTLSVTFNNIYAVGALGFGEQAAVQIDREVIDVVYGTAPSCTDCDPGQDVKRIYAVTKSSGTGSPGLPAELIYSLDGGATWVESNIGSGGSAIGASEDPVAIEIVGSYLLILTRTAASSTTGGYYYALIGTTGAPGSFTKVTSGFVANKQPNDLYVLSPRAVFFVADGGYVYKSTDITTGVTVLNAASATSNDLLRIRGVNDTIVATGRSSTIIRSINGGATFAATDATVAGTPLDVSAVEVLDNVRYWVGTATSGRLYYTLDGGASWTEKPFSGSGSGSVRDIVFPTDSVGYVSHDTSTPTARLFSTWNGGADWTNAAPRVLNLPTFGRANRIAVPRDSDPTTMANTIALAGLSGGGTDGILIQGIADRL